ncbi:DNA-binding domain-containing protein [Novosphingobium sp. Chol11]|uniref:HvfC/BufC N-terminal domain-containing protein n=1 Tax=Novosphingobium sp. Chol11 TaxID=1385763 RepID=UPI0025DA623E|nr:DNA-binding domain-containing protein [Novosphingobium sp. Chol11]
MNLAELQHTFRDWLVEADETAEWRLGGGPGTAIYQNNYRTSLMGCLGENYKRVASWLGEDTFEAAAARYVDAHPPTSWTLDAYGERFGAFLARIYPDDPEVADLAAIDWAVGQVFVSADAAALRPEALAVEDWDTAVIRAVPSLRQITLASNADAIWRALAAEEMPPAACREEEPVVLLFWRQGLEPVFRRAAAHDLDVLAWSAQGLGFGPICAQLAQTLGEEAAVSAAGTVLGQWLTEEMVAAIG